MADSHEMDRGTSRETSILIFDNKGKIEKPKKREANPRVESLTFL